MYVYIGIYIYTYIHTNNYTARLHILPDYDSWCVYDFVILIYLKKSFSNYFET